MIPSPRLAIKDITVIRTDKIICPQRACNLVDNSGQYL